MRRQEMYETLKGEGLKSSAEIALQLVGPRRLGARVLEAYAFNGERRVVDPRLEVNVAGIEFENPVLFGAGWDKKGRAIHGLYHLGFAGGEIGTVLPFGQDGNPKPRLWTIDDYHRIGLNRLGFNSPGQEVVGDYLDKAQPLPCPIGLNVGRNKIMENNMASWAHDKVIRRLSGYASYITLGISSPNSPGLRGLQEKGPLRELLQGAKESAGELPVFVKIDSERSQQELDDMIEISLEEGSAGFVATNTYMDSDLKAKYGDRWAKEAGGLSGADPDYRRKATKTVKHIYEAAGDKLVVIGVGGVDSAESAMDKIKAGASAVQVVTAIRPSKGKVAAQINKGLLDCIEKDGVSSIGDYVGIDTSRVTKAA